jgi:AraC-like DNA-binding protein
MNFTITEGLFIIVIFQLLFISIFLFTYEKGKRISNILLGTFFLSISLNLLDSFLGLRKLYLYNTLWVAWGSCLPLLFGPLLYLYAESILYRDFKMLPGKWIHFLPFVLLFAFTEGVYMLQSQQTRLSLIENMVQRKIPIYVYWASAIIFLQYFLYIAASLRLIRRYRKIAGDRFSDQNRHNISWLSSTIIFFTLCMVLAVLNGFIGLTPLAQYYYLLLTLIVLGIFIFIIRVLLKALRKPEIFALLEEDQNSQRSEISKSRSRYQGSTLKDEDKKRILDQIVDYMKNKKPYLEPELTLEQLAADLSLKPKILSQMINESLNQNFFDFINRYRIEDARKLLTNPADKKITVLEVLYEVGFNSKSSFNTLFKKHTGLTPSEFKRKHLS